MYVIFKGENYQEDCGIYISETLKIFGYIARLQREGVVVDIDEDQIEILRDKLQKELDHLVRVFIPHE